LLEVEDVKLGAEGGELELLLFGGEGLEDLEEDG
jgi:hypothetical protein